ncbi:hypothetical protein [Streptomyces antibioticus]|uniref:hypothetical protein n=1 Tax=Streptomyces antibioticus TaxID=1890 RepID=UPI0033A0E5E1
MTSKDSKVAALENVLAYTTRSADGRGLGEVGVVGVVGGRGDGEELWRLAQGLGGRGHGQGAARWILIQASRARAVAAFADVRSVTWTAYVRRRFVLDALFANHEVLLTGRMELPGRFR